MIGVTCDHDDLWNASANAASAIATGRANPFAATVASLSAAGNRSTVSVITCSNTTSAGTVASSSRIAGASASQE